ncbi:GAF and ANTAR domain-containing protein [Nocardia otitidiscaviarum]|uniref:GAF and ANTAR domain-containing protein n=1 Tax=Nocardia otitidiscaviarum TaxID=1823 RepID=A0A516NG70_9NOCA|nr:GAF and ANTAR domain-containing protein [Nocardia otitidiscaviarum]MCP9623279.1 GAF and ANTAR domain-containing protein [Nocardia otitidiscaviarum]QDP77904.1 GAF and ANTAR domain-containing protein [Nocardia otitidiscaviarum]
MASRESKLLTALVRMADSLVEGYDPIEIAQQLVDVIVEVLPVDTAGSMLADHRGRLHVLASTSEATRLLELFQIQSDAGPCLTAYQEGVPVLVPDLGAQRERWPAFADRARAEGWASVYALPMRLRTDRIGAINLFASPRTGQVGTADITAAQSLADVATIGILHARTLADSVSVSAQLQRALNSRVVIEQAKGMLAEQGHVTLDAAFAALRTYARNTNTRILDLAMAVIDYRVDMTTIITHRPGQAQ